MKRRTAAGLALAAALLTTTANPGSADWLVTRKGTRVETRGVWQVKGKLVVFHTPDGTLSSLRLSEVDLEASGRATAEAVRARQVAKTTAAQAPARKAPVLVLTDDNVRHVGDGASAPGTASPNLAVASWERSPEVDGQDVVLTGTLQNSSGAGVTDAALSVQLLDAEGQVVATGQATLTSTTLDAGQRSGFRVAFPNAPPYSQVKFDPRGTGAPAKPEETEKEQETP